MLSSPNPDLDIFHFPNNIFYGIYFSPDCLTENEMLRATWLEIKTDNTEQLKEQLLKAGVTEIEYNDKNHFYFQ